MRIFIFIFFFLSLSKLFAQPETISADRPGNAYTSTTVGHGVFQFQNGFDFIRQKETFENIGIGLNSPSDISIFSRSIVQSNLVRIGLGKKHEFDVGFDYRRTESSGSMENISLSGLSKLSLGYRGNILEGKDSPSLSVLVNANFNGALNDFQSLNPDVFFLILSQSQISKTFSATTNLGFDINTLTDDNKISSSFLYTFNIGMSINEKLSTYIETFGALSEGTNTPYFDTGLAYLINNNVQLDLLGGVSSRKGFLEYFVSTGVSWRIGN